MGNGGANEKSSRRKFINALQGKMIHARKVRSLGQPSITVPSSEKHNSSVNFNLQALQDNGGSFKVLRTTTLSNILLPSDYKIGYATWRMRNKPIDGNIHSSNYQAATALTNIYGNLSEYKYTIRTHSYRTPDFKTTLQFSNNQLQNNINRTTTPTINPSNIKQLQYTFKLQSNFYDSPKNVQSKGLHTSQLFYVNRNNYQVSPLLSNTTFQPLTRLRSRKRVRIDELKLANAVVKAIKSAKHAALVAKKAAEEARLAADESNKALEGVKQESFFNKIINIFKRLFGFS